jgi:hypothetical protein
VSTASRRSGAALAAVLVVLLVIDCVVLGTMQLALLEQRMAENGLLALRLRVAARSAAHLATARWDPALDAVLQGETLARQVPPPDSTFDVRVVVERTAPALFVVRARVQLAASPHAAASAALLVVPPLLDSRFDVATAALTAQYLQVADGGGIAAAADACTPGGVRAVGLTAGDGAGLAADDRIAGAVESLPPDSAMAAAFQRIVDVARHVVDSTGSLVSLTDSSVHLEHAAGGVHVVLGDAVVAAPFEGLILVGGDVIIEPAGSVRGAVHALGSARVAGHVVLDGCLVHASLAGAGLSRARLLPARPVLPAF